ncbi:MAG: hypothetical protein IJY97_13195 [Clostridia bacterium]|nr:hypothetical protein [Clostridia bacterium]
MSRIDKGVLIFNEWFEAMENISDRDCGRLVKAIYKYQVLGEKPPIFKGKAEILADVVFPCIDRRKKLSEAGKRGNQLQAAARAKAKQEAAGVAAGTPTPIEKNSKEKNSTAKSSESIGRADSLVGDGGETVGPDEKRAPSHEKRARGKYGNVFLSDKEYEEITRVIFNADAYIERFSEKLHVKGYRFESHFDAIMRWWEWDKNLPQYSAPRGLASTVAEREQPRARTAEDDHWDKFFDEAVARSLGELLSPRKQAKRGVVE